MELSRRGKCVAIVLTWAALSVAGCEDQADEAAPPSPATTLEVEGPVHGGESERRSTPTASPTPPSQPPAATSSRRLREAATAQDRQEADRAEEVSGDGVGHAPGGGTGSGMVGAPAPAATEVSESDGREAAAGVDAGARLRQAHPPAAPSETR